MKNIRNMIIYLVGVSCVGKITFFKKFNSRADHEFSVDELALDEIPGKLIDLLLKENEEFKNLL